MYNTNELNIKDRHLICIECEKIFVFEAGEQRFYLSKGLIEPRHCPACREKRKATINRQEGGYYNG